jgi:hypothetical protein
MGNLHVAHKVDVLSLHGCQYRKSWRDAFYSLLNYKNRFSKDSTRFELSNYGPSGFETKLITSFENARKAISKKQSPYSEFLAHCKQGTIRLVDDGTEISLQLMWRDALSDTERELSLSKFVRSQLDLLSVTYGYAYRMPADVAPSLFHLGVVVGRPKTLHEADFASLDRWNELLAIRNTRKIAIMKSKLRDVFQYNILSAQHLRIQVSKEQNLQHTIACEKSWGVCDEIGQGCFEWVVPHSSIARIRKILDSAGALVSPIYGRFLC